MAKTLSLADEKKEQRMVDWNTECLLRFLKEIEARRSSVCLVDAGSARLRKFELQPLTSPLQEVQEIITLPKFDLATKICKHADSVDLGSDVKDQLRSYIKITC